MLHDVVQRKKFYTLVLQKCLTRSRVDEEVKYGGILFAAPVPFCGIFVYKQHVSVEFSHGAKIVDPHGLLEGKGKGRRHVKLHTLEDLEKKYLTDYLRLAQKAAE